MKNGDILIAVDPCYMDGTKEASLVVGKEYAVFDVDETNDAFYIVLDHFPKSTHQFEISSYKEFFKRKELEKQETRAQYRDCPSCSQKKGIKVETFYNKNEDNTIVSISQLITKCKKCGEFHTMNEKFNLIKHES